MPAIAVLLAGLAGLLLPHPRALAGSQLEEPLADSVRSALSSAISGTLAPPEPQFASTQARITYVRWLARATQHLGKRRPELKLDTRREMLQTIWYEAHRAGLPPALVLGLISVESNFRKHAISPAGARGLTQVMPFWSRLIGDGDAAKLFHLQTNIRFGCVILRHYLDREEGDLFMALGRYNGSRGQTPYPKAVLAAQRLWE